MTKELDNLCLYSDRKDHENFMYNPIIYSTSSMCETVDSSFEDSFIDSSFEDSFIESSSEDSSSDVKNVCGI